MINTSSNAFQKLKDIARRRRFVANQIKNGFAFQVRALRKDREMTQQELAQAAETTQTVISRIEKNGASSLNIKTLQKIAAAFDVALVVRLEPIDRLLDWVDNLSPETMAPRKSAEVLAEMEAEALEPLRGTSAAATLQVVPPSAIAAGIQATLVFDRPRDVPGPESGLAAAATTASLSIGNFNIERVAI